jgi:hypothetical protein
MVSRSIWHGGTDPLACRVARSLCYMPSSFNSSLRLICSFCSSIFSYRILHYKHLRITNEWSMKLLDDDDRSFDSFGSEITLLILFLFCVLLRRLFVDNGQFSNTNEWSPDLSDMPDRSSGLSLVRSLCYSVSFVTQSIIEWTKF